MSSCNPDVSPLGMSLNHEASSSSPSSAGAGITGGYDGDSFAIRVIIPFFLGLSMYNVVELTVLIFGTFTQLRGLYFWSLLISSLGIIPYSLGFLFKYFSLLNGGARWVSIVLLTIGWYPMVTGQSVVLWSRLHLIVTGERDDQILQWTKWMIIVDAIVFHIPTTVLTFGSNGTANTATFVRGYNVMGKVQIYKQTQNGSCINSLVSTSSSLPWTWVSWASSVPLSTSSRRRQNRSSIRSNSSSNSPFSAGWSPSSEEGRPGQRDKDPTSTP